MATLAIRTGEETERSAARLRVQARAAAADAADLAEVRAIRAELDVTSAW